MKTKTILRLFAVASLCAGMSACVKVRSQPVKQDDFDETQRFIFYSVLEGCYEDGLSNDDVSHILMRKEKQAYFHFIYACPICTATIWALEAYQARPQTFYSLKNPASTFGMGLQDAQHQKLYSDDPQARLTVINELVRGWLERRMDRMNLSKAGRDALLRELEKKRKQGEAGR